MAPGGFFGQALVVDVRGDHATGDKLRLDDRVLRAYLGGVGLGTWLMHRLGRPQGRPARPRGAARLRVLLARRHPADHLRQVRGGRQVSRSPAGSPTRSPPSHFAIAGKLTGVDAIVIRGRADELSVLLIDGDGPRLEPAPELAGLAAADAETQVRERFGRGWRTAAIGPAGERLVPFATISHDGRHAGRGGLGAVLGSKRVKAIAVRGDRRVGVADPSRVVALAKDLSAAIVRPGHREVPRAGHRRQPPGLQPVRRPADPQFPPVALRGGGPAGRGRGWHGRAAIARNSCARAPSAASTCSPGAGAGCGWSMRSVFALGPLLGVDDRGAVLAASRPVRRPGPGHHLHRRHAGVPHGMRRCGLIAGMLPSGRALRFGDGESAIEAIGLAPRARGAGPPSGDGVAGGRLGDRRRVRGIRDAGEGPGDARLRPEDPADDGPGPGRRHPGGRPQPLRRVRGRLLRARGPAPGGRGSRGPGDRDRGPRP